MILLAASRPLFRFLLAGAGNTAAGFVMICAARTTGMGEVPANAAGYTAGLLISFAANRHWTFRHSGPMLPAMARFAAVALVAWFANLAVLLALIEAGIAGIWAQAGAVATYAVVSYAGCRGWAFAAPERAKENTT